MHLAEVVRVEDRDGVTFVGLDTGWNVIDEHFVYRIPSIRSCAARPTPSRWPTSRWPATSTRATISSPRTIRCPRSTKETSSRSRTSAATTRRWVGPLPAPGPRRCSSPTGYERPARRRTMVPFASGSRGRSRCSSRITSIRSSSRTCGTCVERRATSSWIRATGSATSAPSWHRSWGVGRSWPSPRTTTRPCRRPARLRGATVPRGRGRRNPRNGGLALLRTDFPPGLDDEIRWYGYEPPERVITALPRGDFDVAGWRTPSTEPTRLLGEGEVVDLGDRAFEVLHVPGHTAGSIALWEAAADRCSRETPPRSTTRVCGGRGRVRRVAPAAPSAPGGARLRGAFPAVRSRGAQDVDRRTARDFFARVRPGGPTDRD